MTTQLLVGRTRERAALAALVREHAVVTLIGAAGVGKSALVRATLPDAIVVSLAGAADAAEIAARTAAALGAATQRERMAATIVWDDVAAPADVLTRARALTGAARLVIVSRMVPAPGLPTLELGPLSPDDCVALVAALEAGAALARYARVAAQAAGNPAAAARLAREPAAAALDPRSPALAALCAGRFADAVDGEPAIAAAALVALGALDRAEAVLRAHPDLPRAPLLTLLVALGRGDLRRADELGAPLLERYAAAGDELGHALAAALVARAAFGRGEIARAEALYRRCEGTIAQAGLTAPAPLLELGLLLVAAFRGDWAEARRRAARAHLAAPSSPACAVERWWAEGGAVPEDLDGAAQARFDLRAAERALADGRLDEADRHSRAAERFWRDAGAAYDRALALLARTETLARAGDVAGARKLGAACRALAGDGGYRIVAVALGLVDAHLADRSGDLGGYVRALAAARALAGDELLGGALADACARVGLPRPAAVADGQPMRDRVARLGLARPAQRLVCVGDELRLLADDDALPAADLVVDVDDGTLLFGSREIDLPPQLLHALATIAEAGSEGVTAEELYLAVWNAGDFHPLRHRNGVYVAVNRLRAALEPIAGREALRSSATHYALAPGMRVAVCRGLKRLADVRAWPTRATDGPDARRYARRHHLSLAQARWELALHETR